MIWNKIEKYVILIAGGTGKNYGRKAVDRMYNPQLETFLCVADAGSFNRAAEELYITPTAVIKQMNLLEASLGVKLFERTQPKGH